MRRIWLLLAGGMLCGAAPPSPSKLGQAIKPPGLQRYGWITYCREGSDGFAVNCDATKVAGGYIFGLSTVDEQLVQTITHSGCDVEPRSFPRDEVAGLSRNARRLQTIQTFDLLSLDLRKACPKLPLPPRTFLNPPDLAVVGDEVLR